MSDNNVYTHQIVDGVLVKLQAVQDDNGSWSWKEVERYRHFFISNDEVIANNAKRNDEVIANNANQWASND